MLCQGNTAPYMMYAYARIRGIQRKVAAAAAEEGAPAAAAPGAALVLDAAEEAALGRHLLKFGDVVGEVERELLPSKLCEYIFELSGKFNQFYERCPVRDAGSPELRASRLALCGLSANVLKASLGLLGIRTLERL